MTFDWLRSREIAIPPRIDEGSPASSVPLGSQFAPRPPEALKIIQRRISELEALANDKRSWPGRRSRRAAPRCPGRCPGCSPRPTRTKLTRAPVPRASPCCAGRSLVAGTTLLGAAKVEADTARPVATRFQAMTGTLPIRLRLSLSEAGAWRTREFACGERDAAIQKASLIAGRAGMPVRSSIKESDIRSVQHDLCQLMVTPDPERGEGLRLVPQEGYVRAVYTTPV